MDFHGWLAVWVTLSCTHVAFTLRCACREDLKTCVSIDKVWVDFKTAQERCLTKGGKLPKYWSKDFAALLSNNSGDFWIGAKRKCVNTNANSRAPCPARCVSVSGTMAQEAERSCEEYADGFICDEVHWQTCWLQSHSGVLLLSKNDCSMAPCEHICKAGPGLAGYICSCVPNFRPSKSSPNRCTYDCKSSMCKPHCRALVYSCEKYCSDLGGSPPDSECEQMCECECPDGFIKDETTCVDIDECASNHDCRHQCNNIAGSYTCTCRDGYMLVNRSKCVLRLRSAEGLKGPTSSPSILLTPSLNYTTSHAGVETPVEFVALIVLAVLFIPALTAILYCCKNRKSCMGLNNCGVLDNTRTQGQL